ncbi:hypothetical protein KY337_04690 [Candidatus Woesearchaeota archaeon]|nr:hypothetical protein [Candidatus Woesearchaeota archaeon]
MAVIIVAFFISSMPISERLLFTSNVNDIRTVDSLNNLLVDIQTNYLDMLLRAKAEQGLNAAIEHVYESNDELDVDDALYSVLVYGNISNVYYLEDETLNDSLQDLHDFIQETSAADFSFEINNITVEELDTWHVNVKLNLTLSLGSELAIWQRQILVNSSVNVLGFDDPLYKRFGLNRTLNNTFSDLETTDFQVKAKWPDIERFEEMYDEGLFAPNDRAPSFLDRLSGAYEKASDFGYESFFNLSDAVHVEGLPGYDLDNHVDHLFEENRFLFEFKDDFDGFIIHSSRLDDYNLCDASLVQPLRIGVDEPGWEDC